MGNEDRKTLKQNVASMPCDNDKEIEINGGAGEIGIKVVKVAQWKTKCKSYFNRYYKTSKIIMVPSDGDTIMNTLSSLCSEGRGFVFKNYDIAKHLELYGYGKVRLKTNLGAAPTGKSISYITYIEQMNAIFICEKISKGSNTNQCLKNIAARVKYFLTLYNKEIQGSGVTVIGLLIRENEKQEELVECSFCHFFSPLYEFFESSTTFKNWLKFIKTYEGWWNLGNPKKQKHLFDDLVTEILCFMALQEKEIPTLTENKSQQFKQTYFLYTPQQMDIHFSDAKHVVIHGSYGSGKSLLGLKKLEVIWKGLKQNEKIMYINFDRKSNLHFLMEKNVKENVGILSRKIKLTASIPCIVESPGQSIYVCHNSAGENLSAILEKTVRLNMKLSEAVKINYHFIIEEYDGETLCHDEAAKITKLVKSNYLIESNIILLAQPLMKNRIWKKGKNNSERETCMFHELKDSFKIVKLQDVLRCSNEICRVAICTQNFVQNKDSVFKTNVDMLTHNQRQELKDGEKNTALPSVPESNNLELETSISGKISRPSNDSSNVTFEQRQQPEDSKNHMILPCVPESNNQELETSLNEKLTNPGYDSSKIDESLGHGMNLDQAFKRSCHKRKNNTAKSKIVSKFTFSCEPRQGVEIEGLKPNLVEFSEEIILTSDMAVIALALVLKNFIGQNEATTVLHMADEQPRILKRTIQLLPRLLNETFSFTQDIGVYLEKNKQHKMIFCSSFCSVNGMEFDHVVIVVNESEYYLKYYIPQAITRCTYDLTIVLLPEDKINNENGILQKITNFVSRTRNDQAKETVAFMIEEPKRECLVKQVTVAECKACGNSCDSYSISNVTENKQTFGVHTHSDQYESHLFHLTKYTELEKEVHFASASTLADAE